MSFTKLHHGSFDGFSSSTDAFYLLAVVSSSVKRSSDPVAGLEAGQCQLSGIPGWTRSRFRHNIDKLERWGFISISSFNYRRSGTVVSLLKADVFDPNLELQVGKYFRPFSSQLGGQSSGQSNDQLNSQSSDGINGSLSEQSVECDKNNSQSNDQLSSQQSAIKPPQSAANLILVKEVRSKKDKNNSAGQAVASPKPKKPLKQSNPEAAEKRDELIALWCDLHEPQFGRAYAREFGKDEKAAMALLGRTSQSPHEIMAIVTKAWALQVNPKAWACQKAVTLKAVNAYWADLQAEIDRANSPATLKPNGQPSLEPGKAKLAIAMRIGLEKRLPEIADRLSELADKLRHQQDRQEHPELVKEREDLLAEQARTKAKLAEMSKELTA